MSQNGGGGAPTWGSSPASGWGAAPPGTPPAAPGFGQPSQPVDVVPSGSSGAPVSAPVAWLAVAAVLEVVGLVLGLLADGRPLLSVLGWLVGGFGAIGALAWFTLADSRRRTDPWYSTTRAPALARTALAVAAVVVVAVNALQFADWASRQ